MGTNVDTLKMENKKWKIQLQLQENMQSYQLLQRQKNGLKRLWNIQKHLMKKKLNTLKIN